MLVSFSWIQSFIKQGKKLDPEKVAALLTQKTVEVEGIIRAGEHLENIVVGEIIAVAAHPNADKLKVCRVSVGKETLSIVCGGSNVVEGMLVAVAKVGARVRWHGEGDLITLEPAEIRGVASSGMICGADEIGLASEFPKKGEKEILDLSDLHVKPGTLLAEALHKTDIVFDIDNKSLSNRPDLLSHVGLAREVAALTKTDFNIITAKRPGIMPAKGSTAPRIVVESAKDTPLFEAVAISGITNIPSPSWLTEKLTTLGIASIHPVVDVTNYVMLEYGQPLHAYDAAKVQGKKLEARRAKAHEEVTTLDGKKRKLSPEILVIADAEKVVGVAGIMGGKETEVGETTTSILLEAANFTAGTIRRGTTMLGLRTDASTRYEKSLDPCSVGVGLTRAVELLRKIYGPSIQVSKLASKGKLPSMPKPLLVSWKYVEEFLGTPIPIKEGMDILLRLGFGVKKHGKDQLSVGIPTRRATKDISRVEDIVEEIIRVYGYDKIKPVFGSVTMSAAPIDPVLLLERKFREVLSSQYGANEVYTYSFVRETTPKHFGVKDDTYIRLDNPIASDRPLLRRHLLESVCEAAKGNIRRVDSLRLFETGVVFRKETSGELAQKTGTGRLPHQPLHSAFLFGQKGEVTPYKEAYAVLSGLMRRLRYRFSLERKNLPSFLHPGRGAVIVQDGEAVGYIGELHPDVIEAEGLPYRVAAFEVDLVRLASKEPQPIRYVPIPVYPDIVQDIALVVSEEVTHETIQQALSSFNPLISRAELFDVYRGEHIAKGKKSLAYHLTYRSVEKTLTTSDVDAVHRELLRFLEKEFGATVRE